MKNFKRRGFLSGISGGFASTLALSKLFKPDNANAQASYHSASNIIENPNDVKLNVKMVYSSLIHSDSWEGPCQAIAGQSGDKERASHRRGFQSWVESAKKNISDEANILEPEFVEYFYVEGNFKRNEKEFAKLEADKDEVDLYYVSTANCSQVLASEIGKRFKKPVTMMGTVHALDTSAHLKHRGREGYTVFDYNELNHIIRLLRTRKVFQQLNMLLITSTTLPSVSSIAAVYDFEDLQKRFGIRTKIIPISALEEEMERLFKDNDIKQKAEAWADKLIKNAQMVYIDRKYVVANGYYHFAQKNLMERYGCNAFSIDCWEFCGSRLPEKWKVVPCITHTLLNDEGYVSCCHMLLNQLLSMSIIQTLANRTAFVGGLQPLQRNSEFLGTGHNTPGLKMNGYDKPDIPYLLGNFCESGWGAKISINFLGDFAAENDNNVTLISMSPGADKIVTVTGKIVDAHGDDVFGCTLWADIKLKGISTRDYLHLQDISGHHNVMVYGDYTKDIKEIGKMLGMEVIVAGG